MTKPHKQDSPVELLHPDLTLRHARWRLVRLLDEDEADRRTRVGRRHRQRHRRTRTTRAHPRQPTHDQRRR